MDLRFKTTATCLVAAVCAVLAAPAFGAPAGDEYLPKVPKASGNSSSQEQNSVSSADSSSSETGTTDTTDTTETQGAVPAGGGGDSGNGDGMQPKVGAGAPAPIDRAPASSGDDSSDSTLFSPIVILLIAGVLIAAVGMTLRRRNAAGEEGEQRPDRPERGKTPPTPDGEIVAGGDKAR